MSFKLSNWKESLVSFDDAKTCTFCAPGAGTLVKGTETACARPSRESKTNDEDERLDMMVVKRVTTVGERRCGIYSRANRPQPVPSGRRRRQPVPLLTQQGAPAHAGSYSAQELFLLNPPTRTKLCKFVENVYAALDDHYFMYFRWFC